MAAWILLVALGVALFLAARARRDARRACVRADTANSAARRAERAKMAFLANMSHELRTPMNGIVGMADLIIDHPSTEPMQRLHAETIIRSAKTLQMVIDEVLDVATLTGDVRRLEPHPAPFPLLYLAEEAAQIVSCIISAWGVELSLVHDFALQTMYDGDARHIRQILVQILTHASRLTRDNRIRLEVAGVGSLEEERVAFRVIFQPRDDVDASFVDDLFNNPGQAGEETRSALSLGIFNDRIGLPLTRELVRASGGTLAVTRQFKDIRCEVILPLTTGGRPPQPLVAPDLNGLRALVAAAAPGRGMAGRECFEYAGAAVSSADTADGVRERLLAARQGGVLPDFLFLDADLVSEDALVSFIDEVRDYYRDGAEPNIMLVVSSDKAQDVRLAPSAVRCLLMPPVCPSELWYKADCIVAASIDADGEGGEGGESGNVARKPRRRRSTRVERMVQVHADVLLVEDNPVNQMVEMGLLKRIGCRPVLAKNGEEALEAITGRGEKYDLVLMDCQMPVMDGYEATKRLRNFEQPAGGAGRHVIVALTANSLAGDREQCLAAGMDDYVTKPVTLERLRDCLLKHCAEKVIMLDVAVEEPQSLSQ